MNNDYNNVIRCLTINPMGIECEKSDEDYLRALIPFFSSIKPTRTRPDALAIIDSIALLLEHFQFDNSKINRKGSMQNQVAAETDRKIDEKLSNNPNNCYVLENEEVEKSGIFYVRNFQKQFSAHAKKIEEYITEVEKESKQVIKKHIIGFVIEDASPLGSGYYDNKLKFVNLLFAKEFLDLFENLTMIDFVVFAMTGNDDNRILSFITHNSINEHRKKQIVVSNIPKFIFEKCICASMRAYVTYNKKG